jgi:uncharacterized membrane protein
MNRMDLARKLLAAIRRMPNATPAEALAEFRRMFEAQGANGKR